MNRPTAAIGHFPYPHRTVAQIDQQTRKYMDDALARRRAGNSRPWLEWEDAFLCHCVAEGWTFAKIGNCINRTKDACIGRFYRARAKGRAA